jgi:hypothetical protein
MRATDSSSAAFGGLKGKYDDFDGSLLVRGASVYR